MVELRELVDHCNKLLDIGSFRDYAPNGLQVEGKTGIKKVVTGVTASQALIDAAVAAKADALIVHHGFFWKGEAACITGLKYKRLRQLIKHDISLIAYHLPLDAHSVYGNNVQLADILNIEVLGRCGNGSVDSLVFYGRLPKAMDAKALSAHLKKQLGRPPLHLQGEGELIEKIAWCSGAAQGYIDQAYEAGVQAYISGEVSEYTTHFARESGVHYFAAGHHATERYGVQALGNYLEKAFAVDHEFIDIENPV